MENDNSYYKYMVLPIAYHWQKLNVGDILLRNMDHNKLSYEDTYKAMAEEQEDWSDFDQTLLDGLE